MIKNFEVPSHISNHVEKVILSEGMKWTFRRYTISPESTKQFNKKYKISKKIGNYKILEKCWFQKVILSKDQFDKDLFREMKSLQDFIALKVIEKPVEVVRVYTNIFLYSSKNGISQPHVDIEDDNYISCVYYVNNSSGDTIIFDDQKNIVKSIPPKKGTGVLFDSNMLHSGSYPKDENEPRFVMNFLFRCV